jgi:hypothetical protein
VQDVSRGAKYQHLPAFFDLLDTGIINQKKKQLVQYLLQFLIKNAMRDPEEHFCNPFVIQHLLDFLKEEGTKFCSKLFFQLLSEELKAKHKDANFMIYLVQVLSYIPPSIIKAKSKYSGPLIADMRNLVNFKTYRMIL